MTDIICAPFFTCALCGGRFEAERSDEEAKVEADEIWGASLGDDPAVVCDVCWRKMMGLPPNLETEATP